MLAAIGDTPYNIMLFLHIVSAMIGFAPIFVQPILIGRGGSSELFETLAHKTMRVYGNAIVFSGLIGFGVAGLSDKVYRVRQPWLIAAVVVWIGIVGAVHAGVVPAERAIAEGNGRDEAAEQKLRRSTGVVTALFLVQIYLMVFKPGI
ncbi:MAG: hypothetical protein AAGA90_11250 [Actinomycetota bacterium]